VTRNAWIQTATGVAFDLLAPRSEDVRTADLCRALAWIMRYTGHAGGYSVAAHSIFVGRLVARRHPKERELHLAALLHDAHEAYVGDLSSPVKAALDQVTAGGATAYRRLDRDTQAAVMRRYGVDPALAKDPRVVEADLAMLHAERDRYLGPPVMPWNLGVDPPTADELEDIHFDSAPWLPWGNGARRAFARELDDRLRNVGRGDLLHLFEAGA
jgi:hypothetical protein